MLGRRDQLAISIYWAETHIQQPTMDDPSYFDSLADDGIADAMVSGNLPGSQFESEHGEDKGVCTHSQRCLWWDNVCGWLQHHRHLDKDLQLVSIPT
jgi:hypothetical protein